MLARAKDGAASTPDLQRMLEISKSINAVNAAAQAAAAAAIAERRDHGDGGAEVLAASAGLSRRDAHSHLRTAKAIEDAPTVRDAVESGRVPLANARRLADAAASTSARDVESDPGLLADAETMQPDQFARRARRWATERQRDGGESEHARKRARRRLRMWNGDDGMFHLYGEFDAVTGKRIGNRLEAEARRMHRHDKKHPAPDGSHKRTFRQCMADALDNLTALNSSHSRGGNSGGDTTGNSSNSIGDVGNGGGNSGGKPFADIARTADRLDGRHAGGNGGGGKAFADIAVVWHLNADTEKLVAEIAGGDPLPASVLEELMCNCSVTGLLDGTDGVPLWRGQTKRRATPGQTRALIAKYGGCFHCGAHPAMCQAHHIKPWHRGGPTDISNLVLACWNCHQRIHHHNWHIRTTRGQHTLHPPGPRNHNPTRGPEPDAATRAGQPAHTDANHTPDPPRTPEPGPQHGASGSQTQPTQHDGGPTPKPGSQRMPDRDTSTPRPPPGTPPDPRPQAPAATAASPLRLRDGPAEPPPPSKNEQLFSPA